MGLIKIEALLPQRKSSTATSHWRLHLLTIANLLSLAAATIIPQIATAQSRSPSNAVVRLSSSSSGCGSGFFIEQGSAVMTNAHIAALLCKGTSCPNVRIEQDRGGGRFESAVAEDSVDLRLKILLPSIDLAVLELPAGLSSPFALTFARTPISIGMAVTTIGFPHCAGRLESTGTVSDLTTASFLSGTQGASGSSGGPVLDTSGDVVGVVFQADSLLRPLFDTLGAGHYALRAVRADLFQELTSSPLPSLRGTEAELLLKFYTADIANFGGLTRLKRGLQFLNAARMLTQSIVYEPAPSEMIRSAALLDRSPDSLLRISHQPPQTPEGRSLELLAFVANLEARGTIGNSFASLSADAFATTLREQGRSPEEVQRFLSFLPKEGAASKTGALPLLAVLVFAILLATIIILLIWAGSLGYVYAQVSGSRWRKFIHTAAVAILLWPISLLAFRFYLRRTGAKPGSKTRRKTTAMV